MDIINGGGAAGVILAISALITAIIKGHQSLRAARMECERKDAEILAKDVIIEALGREIRAYEHAENWFDRPGPDTPDYPELGQPP